ncbi:MAG TPA: sugar phosphate nucleotidyltransferase [bacterium]|nr:sugar phosphate nucleotidyltransferase [bacterium]HQL62095.1 sugar phosphate nucleotidyltransferase [bacterium]
MNRTERVVILAGGKGHRLRPFTWVLPKPLVPIGELSILEIVIRQLHYFGFTRITLAVGYRADLVMAVMGDGHRFHVEIDYSIEEKPLGTIGPLSRLGKLEETVLVINGDTLTDLNYVDFLEYHKKQGGIATIAATRRHTTVDFGTLTCDENYRVISFSEKPSFDYIVSMGVYAFSPDILNWIPQDGPFWFDNLMENLLKAGEPVHTYPFLGRWLDIGRLEDYEKAVEEFDQNRSVYLPDLLLETG